MSAFLARLKAYQESGTHSRCRRPWPHGGWARNGSPGRQGSSRELLQARASGKSADSCAAAPQLRHAPAGATARRVLPSQANEKYTTSCPFGASHSIPTAIRPRLPLREIEYPEGTPGKEVGKLNPTVGWTSFTRARPSGCCHLAYCVFKCDQARPVVHGPPVFLPTRRGLGFLIFARLLTLARSTGSL